MELVIYNLLVLTFILTTSAMFYQNIILKKGCMYSNFYSNLVKLKPVRSSVYERHPNYFNRPETTKIHKNLAIDDLRFWTLGCQFNKIFGRYVSCLLKTISRPTCRSKMGPSSRGRRPVLHHCEFFYGPADVSGHSL